MCGIVGYTGSQPAVPVLIDGLRRLEYRGYDSAGIAVFENGSLLLAKKAGNLCVLEEAIKGNGFKGNTGIGHTRWATHGAPTDINAHPHTDCTGNIAVVHNGIIENYLELREWLKAEGHKFRSETDTEVLPHLIEQFYNGDLYQAMLESVRKLKGSYALLAININEPGRVVVARQDSPLVLGLGEGENFIASDIPALLPYTRRTYLLDDGEVAEVTADSVKIATIAGTEVSKEIFYVHWEAEQAEKGGYDHFMLKEIHEQPKALRDTIRGRISGDCRRVTLDKELHISPDRIKNLRRIFITACGTAYHAGVVGKYVIEKLARLPVEVDIASEFRYRDPMINPGDLVIVVSQSGETADTRAALREAKSRGAHVLAITNVVGSSVAREAGDVIYTWAGPEIAVASTKAYVTQLISFYLLALWLAEKRGTVTPKKQQELLQAMKTLPGDVEAILHASDRVEQLARTYAGYENIFFIGRGLDYAVAMEGSLKLKEISYIHAEAYAAGELKHGTLALVVPGVCVIALATQPELFEKTVSNIKEVKARDAEVVALTFEGMTAIKEVADHVIYLPPAHPTLAPVLAVVPLQLFAYYAAVARGCEVDKPRNLAKSVTVE
ncbi:MAG: glutamine--fructose-6-phosphate transaminase (isomerizing) [Peptococcaceae bacterium]|nr:glutamine--fructose-6-phosphate transaminase (isomerizing) [Peptococcaceae bacterium]